MAPRVRSSGGPKALPSAGLCAECLHARAVRSAKGSKFLYCRRSETDPAYVRYPRLPVTRCPGFAAGESGSTGRAGERS
ncbi:MAG: hypothetical protein ACREQ9_09615 [Candidatus Binatia bacterium]